MREARLTCLSAQYGNEANLQALAQINNNIPILLLTSVYLKLLSTKIGASNILFSSRDCYYLSRLFNLLREQARWNIASEYFYTSRICRTSPSDSYLKYFQSRASPNTLVVDLAGTGWSLEQLYEKAGVTPHTFLLHHLSNSPLKERYQQIQKSEKSIIPFSMLDGLPLDNSQLETVNYVDSGMVLDVLVVDGYDSAIPVLEYPNYPKSTVNVIRNIESTHELFANVLAHFDLPALVHEIEASADKIAGVVAELYKHLCDTNSSMRDLALYHARQDRRTMWKLKK